MSVRRGVNRSKSPDALKAIRSSESVASEITAPPIIGRHSDKRAVLRHAREELPPESIVVVEKLMNDFNAKGGGRLSPVRVSTADRRTVLGTPQTPNARLPPDVLGSTNTAIFGTTQISGCQGDFCTLDIRKVENKDIDLGSTLSTTTKLSEFRQNLMRGDEFDIGDKLPLSPGGSIATDTSGSQKTPFSIPYRTVIQTRQEMPFVKLALERHRRGEDGDYVSEEYYNDLATSGKLPSVFYKDVPCCENCYKVYNIIEEARAKALAKIVARKNSPSKKTRTVAGNTGTRVTTGSSSSLTAPGHTNAISLGTKKPADTVLHPRESESGADETLKTVVRLIDGLTKMDIAEIRTMTKPPAAVEIVLEAVMVLLTGKVMPYLEIRKLMGSGESFLLMLRDFRLSEVSEDRLQLIEPYVDNPVFRPENVMPVSLCASKFCGWVIGVVQAARWQRGKSHKRIDIISEQTSAVSVKSKMPDKPSLLDSNSVSSLLTSSTDNLTFMQKLERRKAKNRQQEPVKDITRSGEFAIVKKSVKPGNFEYELPRSMSPPKKVLTDRERTALAASQKRAADRLSSHSKSEGNMAAVGEPKTFRCADGITKMTYIALGSISLESTRSNFIVVHDFFDTCDATAIFFKPIVQRHNGCQIFCFNYPGQANTTWPRPPAAERQRGAPDLIFNNDWIADRMHELLQHAEENGDILLTNNFHLVGFGNGACIATAFLQKWGKSPLYSESLKSFVAINGFLYPDPQLSAILHSAAQVFESTPHNRPDIPVSYWARFIFSEEYLGKINPNLALNILTAVSNPITNEGRMRISRGCLQHRDMRAALSPENLMRPSYPGDLAGYSVPVILVQSTENALVNASNVDNFLMGRKAKHLWSHQQNILSEQVISKALDPLSRWVGKMSSGPIDYQKYSVLGTTGLRLLLDCLNDERGAFVIWSRAGHHVCQENKAAVLDLIDALAFTNEDYFGLTPPPTVGRFGATAREESKNVAKMEVMFKILPPKKTVVEGFVKEEVEEEEPLTETDLRIKASYEEPDIVDPLAIESSSPMRVKEEEDMMVQSELFVPEILVGGVSQISDTLVSQDVSGGIEGRPNTRDIRTAPMVMEPKKAYPEPPRLTTPSTVKSWGSGASAVEDHTSSTIASEDLLNAAFEPEKDQNHEEESLLSADTQFVDPPGLLHSDDVDTKSLVVEEIMVEHLKPAAIVHDVPSSSQVLAKHLEQTTPVYLKNPIPVPEQVKATDVHSAYEVNELMSSHDQRKAKKWIDVVPDATSSLELEAELTKKHAEYIEEQSRLKKLKDIENAQSKLDRLKKEQELRRKQYEEEDNRLLAQLEAELEARRKQRLAAEKQRRLEIQDGLEGLIDDGLVEHADFGTTTQGTTILREMPPMEYDEPEDLPSHFVRLDTVSQLDKMIENEEAMKKRGGGMSLEEFEAIQNRMANRALERTQKLRHLGGEEQHALYVEAVRLIQRIGRGYNGRKKAAIAREKRELQRKLTRGIIAAQALVRGISGRKRFARIKRLYQLQLVKGAMALKLQAFWRGYVGRCFTHKRRRLVRCRDIQRSFRGYIGRKAANREKKRLALIQKKFRAASKIQSLWRMKVAREEFRSMRIHVVAACEVQRIFRGYLGRKLIKRRREWSATQPGPERIKLGLKLIEESKIAFERQEEEIDALHRAQERAEARVSHIHAELKESEKELMVLERELQEIDQIENDLKTLTHERDLLTRGVRDAAGMPRLALEGHNGLVLGHEPTNADDPDLERRKKAEAYALEMTIQIKRAEREKKRQELETEFAAVFQEVEKKKKALARLESSLADMEATRERKDREFRRLQKNLMQLLLEQKQELDDLREKGIELETATAVTAAAATATAQKAKEHDERSKVMFSQTEELMKFQFMSMSLSYFSSLNMLKQLRDMNADTTSAAITSSADAAAAAAASAAAANLPNIKKLDLGANDFVELSIQKKKQELAAFAEAEKQVKKALKSPLPEQVRLWTVSDVATWLETLSLGQYIPAFREATVDGPFLMEIREEDLTQILGMRHKLHVRKLLVSREKLKPLSVEELKKKKMFEHEEDSENTRKLGGAPDMDTVFSQCRNGRNKRLEDSLNEGFPVDAEDENGNTLLLIACQNSHRRIVEMLLIRGANVNHQNAQGNTALHFALAFDQEGLLGEYLIEHGADDSIENLLGLTPYDGITPLAT